MLPSTPEAYEQVIYLIGYIKLEMSFPGLAPGIIIRYARFNSIVRNGFFYWKDVI
jgi:hypothetical protein